MVVSKVQDLNQDPVEHTKPRPRSVLRYLFILTFIALTSLTYTLMAATQGSGPGPGPEKSVARVGHKQKNSRRETPWELCNCGSNSGKSSRPRTLTLTHTAPVTPSQTRGHPQSTCSEDATLLGPRQKVISFSLFAQQNTENGNGAGPEPQNNPRYLGGLRRNLEERVKFYPDWVIRVYSNIDLKKPVGQGQVCPLICEYPEDLFFCNVKDLPMLGDVSQNILPMAWRFLVLGDPTVWKFGVRDLDSRLNQRERDAVAHWENSSFPLHGMRDHPLHGTSMMGGMWGGDNVKLGQRLSQSILRQIVETSLSFSNDQYLLTGVIYNSHSKLILTHDSYLCNMYGGSVPFPSRRPNNFEYVGQPVDPDYISGQGIIDRTTGKKWKLATCPVECRPSYGKDWDYC